MDLDSDLDADLRSPSSPSLYSSFASHTRPDATPFKILSCGSDANDDKENRTVTSATENKCRDAPLPRPLIDLVDSDEDTTDDAQEDDAQRIDQLMHEAELVTADSEPLRALALWQRVATATHDEVTRSRALHLATRAQKQADKIEPLGDGFVRVRATGDVALNAFTCPLLIRDAVFTQLLPHQRDGLRWMWQLHRSANRSGGVLGDDMGLGKTVQVVLYD